MISKTETILFCILTFSLFHISTNGTPQYLDVISLLEAVGNFRAGAGWPIIRLTFTLFVNTNSQLVYCTLLALENFVVSFQTAVKFWGSIRFWQQTQGAASIQYTVYFRGVTGHKIHGSLLFLYFFFIYFENLNTLQLLIILNLSAKALKWWYIVIKDK